MGDKRRNLLFLLFALSGFSGLIYESIWTHYLKLFLGHSAYAQTLVLAIFMGGMAIGSWLCSRYSTRWKNVLLGYAVVEAIIGLCALVFHTAFVSITDVSYSVIIPRLPDPVSITIFKWTLSALMILPQSVLLGMTFPLMSSALLRLFPDKPGRTVAMLYFTNSIGAVIGVLVSGFLLIRLMGLPWTIGSAGCINIVLALVVWSLIGRAERGGDQCVAPPAETRSGQAGVAPQRLLLFASLVTGIASFIYEVGWIRMLSLVLGASTHAFELMLGAFILGLAFGGLWIQRRIDQIGLPFRYLAHVQVVMGALALLTLPLYGETFEVMKWLVKSLPKTDAGYALFNISSSAIAISIMLPATFCAGMTLPLITLLLIKSGHGERSIGAVYATNTVGAIIGVFFAIHVGMPLLGLKGLITCGASLDIALGLVLLWNVGAQRHSYRGPAIVTGCTVCAVIATVLFVDLDLVKMGSGVYRYGTLLPRNFVQHIYHRDGKTATVDVFLDSLGTMRINTNGKTDAAIMMDGRPAGKDEATMILAALIPMLLQPQATSAASIGLGSGLTTHTLLGNPLLHRVDTVEIEQGMVDGAKCFRPTVGLAYSDPRSRIYIDDAKTFFSSHGQKYDIIVSEPSNPWVSGVSGLFSEEFYRLVKRSMTPDGVFVQWVQLYEINVDLVVSVLKAISDNFPDYAVYAPNDVDIIIVAKKNGALAGLDANLLKKPLLSAASKRIQVESLQDIAFRRVGTKRMLEKLIRSYPISANSDYYPVLDQNAARTRFLGDSAQELLFFAETCLPALDALSGSSPPRTHTDIAPTGLFPKSQNAVTAMAIRDYFVSGVFSPRYANVSENDKKQAVQLKRLFYERNAIPDPNERIESIFVTALNVLPCLDPSELETIWKTLESGPCAASLPTVTRQLLAFFQAVGRHDGVGMVATSRSLLEMPNNFNAAALKYLVGSAMIGNLMQGKKEESHRFWLHYKTALFRGQEPDLLFRMLVAESTAR